MFIIFLIFLPNIVINLLIVIFVNGLGLFSLSFDVSGGILVYGIAILSPHGALFAGLLIAAADTDGDISNTISYFPPVYVTLLFMIFEIIAFLSLCIYNDSIALQRLPRVTSDEDPTFNPLVLDDLDEDVQQERVATKQALQRSGETVQGSMETGSKSNVQNPLIIDCLRKVFPPKKAGHSGVIATQDACFSVEAGEIFGLLGANGAGKTTLLSMITRHLIPTSGDALIAGHSILSSFREGSTHLGIVTQTNSLWDLLSVEDHLYLFARLRGVPENVVKQLVEETIDQLELLPHKHKLAGRLSGGMKRKLCVAISLIGDPEIVLLDEPSAGLDPVSRRNLWNVILRTMSERAVVLTTHSMEEAEALCRRIGIMVKGQLRALGTNQRLKSKFGNGYEVTIKLKTHNWLTSKGALSAFLLNIFPSTEIVAENGGLMTYRISKSEMSIGVIFKELEANKVQLSIEDYSVSQPTLEQVFIKIVKDHETRLETQEMEVKMDVVIEYNKCGFSRPFLWRLMGVGYSLFVLCLVIGIFGGVQAFIFLSYIVFIMGQFGCWNLYCRCLQPPKDVDE